MRIIVLVGAIACAMAASACTRGVAAERAGVAPVVTAITTPRDGYPDISPDGRHVVFQSNRSGTWQLWLADADGSDLRRLTQSNANDVTPVWSPDGDRILFASDRAGGSPRDHDPTESYDARDIYVMDVSPGFGNAETRIEPVVRHPSDDMHPEWADGGRRIVFNRVYDSGDGADIVIVDSDGTNERIVATARGWNTYAALTPDARTLVYRGTVEEPGDDGPIQNSDIFSSGPDGEQRVRLTNHAAFDGWPAVSPDGRTIAFASSRSGDAFHIYLMPIGGGEPRQVTAGTDFHYTQPAWSADGKRLAAFRWKEDDAGEIGHIVTLALD